MPEETFSALNDALRPRFAALTHRPCGGCVHPCRTVSRCAATPSSLQRLVPGSHIAGRVFPVRHYGSVDVFLEAINLATPGDVLVIDNGGRLDEACIGDLIALEAHAAGMAGVVIWDCIAMRPRYEPSRCRSSPWGRRQPARSVLKPGMRTPCNRLRSVIGTVDTTTWCSGDDVGVLASCRESQVADVLTQLASPRRSATPSNARRIAQGMSEPLRLQFHFP